MLGDQASSFLTDMLAQKSANFLPPAGTRGPVSGASYPKVASRVARHSGRRFGYPWRPSLAGSIADSGGGFRRV